MNFTFITHVPQKDGSIKLCIFFSLVFSIYTIIIKVLLVRLGEVLGVTTIFEDKSAFIAGRQILDSRIRMVANEPVVYLKF